MLLVTPTVWTSRRKWMGNLVPAIFWFPPALAGVLVAAKQGQFLGTGLWILIASTVVGWLAVNQFGFFNNAKMRKQLELILVAKGEQASEELIFVGFATPKYSSMLDAHEDVGFLEFLSDRIVFVSETRRIEIMKSDISGTARRANVHSLLGLGGWVGIDARLGEKRFRLLVEPRERNTMLASKRYAKKLTSRIAAWLKE